MSNARASRTIFCRLMFRCPRRYGAHIDAVQSTGCWWNSERIAIGEPDDYKPCTARLPDGELLLSCFDQHPANSRPGFQEFWEFLGG